MAPEAHRRALGDKAAFLYLWARAAPDSAVRKRARLAVAKISKDDPLVEISY
jgi:hypothetical protein